MTSVTPSDRPPSSRRPITERYGYHAAMWFFSRRSRPAHDPGVIYVYEKGADYPPYYSAVCRCGWFADPVDVAQFPDRRVENDMAAAALDHDRNADTTVAFPIDRPR